MSPQSPFHSVLIHWIQSGCARDIGEGRKEKALSPPLTLVPREDCSNRCQGCQDIHLTALVPAPGQAPTDLPSMPR